jgi:hypothetical protein
MFMHCFVGSHTAANISSHIDFIAVKFLGVSNLEESNWRPPLTTDGAANISLAIDTNAYAFWMRCCLHMLNLCV